MKYTLTVACIFLRSAWQAVSLRSALTALLLAPLAALSSSITAAAAPPAAFPEPAMAAPQVKAAARKEAWTLSTDDTRLTVGVSVEGQLCVFELSNPAVGWNWMPQPSVLPLVDKALVGGVTREIRWSFAEGVLDASDGQKLTLRFICEQPALELTSVWRAQPGRGPVRHALTVINRSDCAVTIFEQPSLQLELAPDDVPLCPGAKAKQLTLWCFHTEGFRGDPTGVYRSDVATPFYRMMDTTPDARFIPYAVFDAGGRQGVYVGIEWSYCRIAVSAPEGYESGTVRVRGGEFAAFQIALRPSEDFHAPPGFVGAYAGDLDDAGNSLRRFLFAHNTPEVLRRDSGYPKVQWNAFLATGETPGSWKCTESKFRPLVDLAAKLGYEEMMIDVGWWEGGTAAPEPKADPIRWPSGMARAAEYVHKAGMRFGLYWNKGEDMASADGRAKRVTHVKRLFGEYHADMWRSDCTAGPVLQPNYAAVRGFYAMLEQLQREVPGFQWENCSGGGQIKDFGAMQHAVKIFNSDVYSDLDNRKAFYGASFMFPPAQIMGHLSPYFTGPLKGDLKYAFRSSSMGAPEWFLDPAAWTNAQQEDVRKAVATYKTRIRPLVRNANLYHILPRPDGKHWDGIQYYDPATRKGVVYLFKPAESTDTLRIPLRGVAPALRYRVTFEDGSNPAQEKTGAELRQGLDVTLTGSPRSELVFIEEATQ